MFDLRRSRGCDRGALVGRVLGDRFVLTALIGAGAVGEVYEARHLETGGLVAVKVLHRRLLQDPDLAARFEREARNAAMLNHPSSLLVLEAERDPDGTPYLVMELLRGRDLARVLHEDFPLPVERSLRIVSQVLEAIAEAHERHVVHRDLKPSNIMLIERHGSPDFVKVCDYGMAKLLEAADEDRDGGTFNAATGPNIICGTPEYMSPEQARGEPLDGRSDLYAVAVILYQMVTGKVPFRAKSSLGVLTRHLTEAPVTPSTCHPPWPIPPALDELILRGLGKDRDQRPADALQFRAELEAITAQLAGGSVPGPDVLQPPRLAETTAAATIRGAAARRRDVRRPRALLALIAGAFWLADGRRPPRLRAAAVTLAEANPAVEQATPPSAEAAVDSPRAPAAPVVAVARRPSRRPRPAAHPPAVARQVTLSDTEAQLAKGRQLMTDGRIADACAEVEAAKAASPESPALYRFLGQCYMRSRRTADAKKNYRRYLELSPNAPDAAFINSILD